MRSIMIAVGVCVALCPAGRVAASPLFELAGDVSEQAGFSARSSSGGAASTYFNPALLTAAPAGVQLGVFMLNDQIGVSLEGRPGGDVPFAYRGATHADNSLFDRPSVPTLWLRDGCPKPTCPLTLAPHPRQALGSSGNLRAYQALGLVIALVPERLVLGFYGLVPLSKFTTAHSFFSDEREQFFSNSLHPELYSDRLTATSIAFGAGARVINGLSLGLGATLSLRNTANAQSFVGNGDDIERTLLLSTDVGVKVAFAPHFGITVSPLDALRLSATVHTVQRFDIVSGISNFLPDGNKQLAWRTAVHDYLPVRAGFGIAWDVLGSGDATVAKQATAPAGHTLTLVANGVFGLWSQYLDRHGERPRAEYTWDDTFSWVLGVKHAYGHVRSHLDGTYVPTPVPLQTGRTNYVDNDRISAALGIDYEFEVFDVRFRIGAHAQLHALLMRRQTKLEPGGPERVRDEFPDDAVDSRGRPIASSAGLQTNNPGWPGFASSGLLVGAGVNLGLML